MPRVLRKLRIDEISSVDRGAGEGCRIMLYKRLGDTELQPMNRMFDTAFAKQYDGDNDDVPQGARLFNDIMLTKAAKDEKDPPMPQVDIVKLIEVTEQGLMAQVTKRDGESYHQSFARRYENDISFREHWAALTDAKHLMALGKGMATLTPTSTEVGNTNVSDDSAEAVRLLTEMAEMAEKQHRSFEQVFTDPANAKLARQTYTAHHRPTLSLTSGDELQRR